MCQFTSLPTEHLDSSPGSICSIIVCRVPSMLMAICHPFLVFLMAFGRVVPCCCYTMLWSPRYWWSTFTAIPTFLVSVWSLSGLCLLLYGAVPLSPISQYADDTSLILTSDDGSFSVSHDALVYGTSSAHVSSSMSVSSTKASYLFLLSENMVSPHCLEKYAEVYGALDWPAT